MIVQETEILFESRRNAALWPDVTVVIPLYNYQGFITETLNSVREQSLNSIGLVVVDDCSTDASASVVSEWLKRNNDRFERSLLAKNVRNAGLSVTRNTGTSLTNSPFLFFLDADNIIFRRCLDRLMEALKESSAVFAYSILDVFGARRGLMGTEVFNRERFKRGNYIDAMALIRREALIQLGGYHDLKFGWEDFDLWLRICENGDYGIQIPEILGRYRVHANSMLRTVTSESRNQERLKKMMLQRHSWLEL
ncbi:glycosyltransferase family 2 protein [Chelativorans intermedius]|uniref:Glycosyltransferase family 2 protein n=1 Tax=Chelativorans intermedius TaxID=515947 RepID=A0ABV6D673_9HYPH|nr:glycosyltransferase family A protein [Chelativorans intermedius]MCT8997417.1 glycosyltransferase family 2 protein [Chelativorans intermedius]